MKFMKKWSILLNSKLKSNFLQYILITQNYIFRIHTGCSARFNNPLLRPSLFYQFTSYFKKDTKAIDCAFGYQKQLYSLRKKILLEEQQKLSEMNQKLNKNSRRLIDHLILNECQFTEEEIKDNRNQILLAGFETTANQVSHVILMIAMHPEYQEQAYQEIKAVFHSSNEEFNLDTISELRYTEQIIKETLRHFAVAPFILKTTTIDLELDEHVIPKGTTLFFPLHLIHRNKEVWGPNADQFDPDNFSLDKAEKRHPFAYMPFSMGKRNCVGKIYSLKYGRHLSLF